MKKIILSILILLSTLLYSQNQKIPNINFCERTNELSDKFSWLNLKDENCLILKSTYSNAWWDNIISRIIVYRNDGKILKFEILNSYFENEKIQPKPIKIKRKNIKLYWSFLKKCIDENKFSIDKGQLNITTMKIDDAIITTKVSDGLFQKFEIYSNHGSCEYDTYAAKHYIDQGFQGYSERQKLVELMNDFDDLFNKY